MTKLCYFNQNNSSFLSIPSVVSTGSLFVGDEMMTQTWRWIELLQMLKVTVTGSHNHVGSQTLGEVH